MGQEFTPSNSLNLRQSDDDSSSLPSGLVYIIIQVSWMCSHVYV